MGGFGVASLAGAVLTYKGNKVSYTKLLIAYFVIAISWEIYEHVLNYMHLGTWYGERAPVADILDTIKDLIDGFLGMSFAYLFVRK